MIRLSLRLEGEEDVLNGETSIEFDNVEEMMELVNQTIEKVKEEIEKNERKKKAIKASEDLFEMLTKNGVKKGGDD